MRTYIVGSRRLSNIFWALITTIGGCGFFLTGLSSYFNLNLIIFSDVNVINFIPQGIVILFYGSVGSILSIFLWLTIIWDVGFGYNDYNKELKKISLYRKGFPGQNLNLSLNFSFNEVRSIKIRIKEGISPIRQLLLCLKDGREIPLTGSGDPIALKKIEEDAVDLAKYLNIYLETG
jgi:hypothetical protein